MNRRAFGLATLASLFAPVLTKLGKKPETRVCNGWGMRTHVPARAANRATADVKAARGWYRISAIEQHVGIRGPDTQYTGAENLRHLFVPVETKP